MGERLTSKKTCKQKHTYHSRITAKRARKRRNAAGKFYFTAAYQCNVCHFWHLTTQNQENKDE